MTACASRVWVRTCHAPANDSPEGRALNRRVEILLAPKANLVALLQQYLRPSAPAKLASSKP